VVFLFLVGFCFLKPRVCWLLFVYSIVVLSFCFCFASFCCLFVLGGYALPVPSLQGPLPVPVPRVALGVQEPIGSLRAGTPTNQPSGIPTPHRALSVGLPLRGGAPPILPIKRVKGGVRGGRLGLGGEKARANAAGLFEEFRLWFDFMTGDTCAYLGRNRLWVVALLLRGIAPLFGSF